MRNNSDQQTFGILRKVPEFWWWNHRGAGLRCNCLLTSLNYLISFNPSWWGCDTTSSYGRGCGVQTPSKLFKTSPSKLQSIISQLCNRFVLFLLFKTYVHVTRRGSIVSCHTNCTPQWQYRKWNNGTESVTCSSKFSLSIKCVLAASVRRLKKILSSEELLQSRWFT